MNLILMRFFMIVITAQAMKDFFIYIQKSKIGTVGFQEIIYEV